MAFDPRRFIRKTPSRYLKAYLDDRGIHLNNAAWDGADGALGPALNAVIEQVDDERRRLIFADWERVEQLADEAGQRAILDAVPDAAGMLCHFEQIEDAHGRGLWLLLHDTAAFRRAEEIRFADYHRWTPSWEGFEALPGLAVDQAAASIEAFKDRVRTLFRQHDGSGRNLVVELFVRPSNPTDDGPGAGVVQATIYLEGMPATAFEFEGAELSWRVQRPAVEAAVTYDAASGVVEVVAKGGKVLRARLARAFAETLLHTDADPRSLPLRRYALDRLARPIRFPTDPTDGIASVAVTRLGLYPYDGGGKIILDAGTAGEEPVHEMSRRLFEERDPLQGGFGVYHARLTITFHPTSAARRGRKLHVEITRPNGCSLKERAQHERLIGEKYLRRWGLIAEL